MYLYDELELTKLNSMTKYPSIMTYHVLDKQGALTEDRNVVFDPDEEIILTEKIDGTNARIIFAFDVELDDWRYLIGSREQLLYAEGDLLGDPMMDIAKIVKPVAQELKSRYYRGMKTDLGPTVYYGEVYGGKIQAGGNYSSNKNHLGFRFFDCATIPSEVEEHLIKCTGQEIALWRDQGGQQFDSELFLAELNELESANLTPRIKGTLGSNFPVTLLDTYNWLYDTLPHSLAKLDESAGGHPEGIVVRNHDRSKIAKIRYHDYKKALKIK